MDDRELYDVAAAGEKLSLGRTSLYKEMKNGRLRFVYYGSDGKRLIPRESLIRFKELLLAESQGKGEERGTVGQEG